MLEFSDVGNVLAMSKENSNLNVWQVLGVSVLLCLVHQALGETGCPEPDDIKPCVCYNTGESIYLECYNFTDAEELRKIFINSERYTFDSVEIQKTTIQYLPYNIFEKVKIKELNLIRVTLTNLFDRTPQDLEELSYFSMEDMNVMRGIIWQLFEPLKGLRYLSVVDIPIKSLDSEFNKYVTKDLENIMIKGKRTKVKPGALKNFSKLEEIQIWECELKNLTRDYFPIPYNGKNIFLSKNKITSLPEGIFTQMPNLKVLFLAANQIATLPMEAFDSVENVARMESIVLLGNPIKCDCLLLWLVTSKPQNVFGECEKPKRLHGKQLNDLSPSNFNC